MWAMSAMMLNDLAEIEFGFQVLRIHSEAVLSENANLDGDQVAFLSDAISQAHSLVGRAQFSLLSSLCFRC
jgi:hypothetical protein